MYSIGKRLHVRSSKQASTFKCKPQCLIQSQLPPKNFLQPEKKDSLHYKWFFRKFLSSIFFIPAGGQALPLLLLLQNTCMPQSLLPNTGGKKGCTNEVSPLVWWRKRFGGKLMLVLTNLPLDPDKLLKMIWCNCRTDCHSMRSMCRKYNLKCSSAYRNCKGSTCANPGIYLPDWGCGYHSL